MAASTASAFTAPDRRKKIVTYGKASRLPSANPPEPSNNVPSPERPRKAASISHASLNKARGTANAKSSKSTSRDTPDIFDVPSEDEFAANTPTTTKKPLAKRQTRQGQLNAPPAVRTASASAKQVGTDSGGSRATKPARPADSSMATKLQTAVPSKTPIVPIAQVLQRGRTPQPASATERSSESEHVTQRTVRPTKAKPMVQSQTTSVSVPQIQQATKEVWALPTKKRMPNATSKPAQDSDVFDMPSSSDELHVPTPKAVPRVPAVVRKQAAQSAKASIVNRGKACTKSDDSAAAKKRKRRGSIVPTTAVKQRVVETNEHSHPTRRVGSQNRESTTLPGRGTNRVSRTITASTTQPDAPLDNDLRRSRMRTVPILSQHNLSKAQSSPALFRSMVPEHTVPKALHTTEASESTMLEDDTMYEIPTSFATPDRPSPSTLSGSATPRQKALFSSLLGSSSATPSMPSFSRLQLTDSKPRSLLAGLSKSKSDLSHNASSRKIRLIADLKPAESSSDDDGSESESANESGLGDHAVPEAHAGYEMQRQAVVGCKINRSKNTILSDAMDLDETQTSQPIAGFGSRPKLTYATQRSYLQETNPEDAFLLSMDTDDRLMAGLKTKDSQTEDEEESSQARGKHELRRQGQNDGFELETMMLIDDMSVTSTSSIRRTALLELCAKMTDTTFTHALMDSSLAQQFLRNLASNGEIVFDFAAAVAAIFILKTNPAYTVLDQIRHSELLSCMVKLLDNRIDIQKISKNRKTNLSKLAYESVDNLRSAIMTSRVWSPWKPETASPQLVALKALDMLVLGLREVGNKEAIVTSDTLAKLVDIASSVAEQCMAGKDTADDRMVLRFVFSMLESVSLAKQKSLVWSARMMQQLASSMQHAFHTGDAAVVTMAVKLCMNLTNNKPKACQQFSGPTFVQALVRSITERAKLLQQGLDAEERAEVLDTLILSLGAMINLTEHSDQARVNVDDGEALLEMLIKTFVDGSANTQQAISMEETESSVALGYLGVLIGNLCLNQSVKTKVRGQLPGGRLTMLVDKIKEFVRVHEHANRNSTQYEGEEGQEAWQNYTARIMLVVEQLEIGQG